MEINHSTDPFDIYHEFIHQFKQLYYHPSIGLLITDQNRIVTINPQMAKHLGYENHRELLGKSPEHLSLDQDAIIKIQVGSSQSDRNLYFLPAEDYPLQEKEGMILRLSHMLDSKEKPMLLIKEKDLASGKLSFANPSAMDLLSIEKLDAYDLEAYIHPVDRSQWQGFLSDAVHHPSSRKRFTMQPPQRPQLSIYVHAYSVNLSGEGGVLLMLEDHILQSAIDAKNKENQLAVQSYYANSKNPMLILDPKMIIREVNLAFSHLFRFPDEAIIGSDFNDLLSDSIVTDKLTHMDQSVSVNIKDFYGKIHTMKVYELPIYLEDAHIGKYASLLPAQLNATAEYKKLLTQLYQIIPPQILLTDPNLTVLWSCSSNGISDEFSTEAVVGQPLDHFIAKQSRKAFTQAIENLQNGNASWFGQLWFETPGEKQRLRHCYISPVHSADENIFAYALIIYPIQREREFNQLLQTLMYLDLESGQKNVSALQPTLDDWIYEVGARGKRFSMVNLRLSPLTAPQPLVDEDALLEILLSLLSQHLGPEASLIRDHQNGFILLHKELGLKKDAERFVEALLKDLAVQFELENLQDHYTCLFGIACYPADGSERDTLLESLNHSLETNRINRGQLKLSEQKTLALRHKEGMIIQYLREGLHKEEFYIVYQPLIDLSTKKITGMETLLRWKNDAVGSVSPNEFIPLAEKGNVIVKIGYFVIGETIRKLNQLREKGHLLTSSVNISIKQLEVPDFAEKIIAMMDDYELPGSSLEFEITESITASDSSAVTDNIRALTHFGIRFNVDDFGTGYSSLKQIQDLKIKSLKIDKSIIEDMVDNPGNQSLVKAISAMAKSSGLKLIAEGVETQDQLAALEQIGIEEAQGFLFSMPLGEMDIERFIEDHKAIHG